MTIWDQMLLIVMKQPDFTRWQSFLQVKVHVLLINMSNVTVQYVKYNYVRQVKDSQVPVNTCLYGESDVVFTNLLTEIAANSGGR